MVKMVKFNVHILTNLNDLYILAFVFFDVQ